MPYINLKNIDELTLEFHSSMFPKGEWRDRWRRQWSLLTSLDLILTNSIGRKFDDVYHYLCKYKVHKNSFGKHLLIENLNSAWKSYKVENGLICENRRPFKKRKKSVELTSEDFKTALVHPELKVSLDDCETIFEKIQRSRSFTHYQKTNWVVYPKVKLGKYWKLKFNPDTWTNIDAFKTQWGNIFFILNEEEFKKQIIQGHQLIFSSKQDPLYKRIVADTCKHNKSASRIKKIQAQEELNIKFKTLLKRKELEQKQKEKEFLERKGFRPNAFKKLL